MVSYRKMHKEKKTFSTQVGMESKFGATHKSRSDIKHRQIKHELKSKRKITGKKIVIGAVCTVVIILVGIGLAFAMYVNSVNSRIQGIDDEVFQVLDKPENPESPFYTLILGSDTRDEGVSGRSDTIVLARIDPHDKEVSLVSIPRDTQVELPGYGKQKINSAYSFYGVSGAINAISELAGVPIAHVIEVDFSGFKEIVDALGGVEVTVPPNTTYKGVDVPEGDQMLDGEQALVFVRCRKTYASGDYQRAENQRQLITEIAKKVFKSSPSELPSLIDSLASSIKTDMSVPEIVELALKMRAMDTDSIITAVMPSHTGTVDGTSYVFVEESKWLKMMDQIDSGQDPSDDTTDIEELQNKNDESISLQHAQ